MRNPEIIPAYNKHRDQAVASLSFDKDYNFHGKAKVPPIVQWNLETRNCASLPPGTIKSTIWIQNQTQHSKAPLRAYIQENPGHSSSKTTEFYLVGFYFNNWQYSKINKISNGVNTHVSMRSLKNVKNPLDGFKISTL